MTARASGRLLAHLVRTTTWPQLERHWLRALLTALGIALGVTTVVAIGRISRWVIVSFENAVQTVAGDADLEITSPTGVVDDALQERVSRLPEVDAATGVIETFVPVVGPPDEELLLLGIDFLGSPVWRRAVPREALTIPDDIAFATHPDSVLVPRGLAAAGGFEIGSPLRVVTPAGVRALRVGGLIDDVPLTRLFAGRMAVMDLPAAQLVLDRGTSVDRVAVKLAPGQDVLAAQATIAAALGNDAVLRVERPEARGAHAEKLLYTLRVVLGVNSLTAVIVGAFIVYHTVAVSVRERRRELALLNALGVTRAMLGAVCLVEIALLGAVGIAVGVTTGLWIGRVSAVLAAGVASDIWAHVSPGEAVGFSWEAVAGVAVGVGVVLVTAVLALRATFRATTVDALRPIGVAPADHPGSLAHRALVAAGLLGIVWLTVLVPSGLAATETIGLIMGAHAIAYAAVATLAPAFILGAGLAASRLAGAVRWPALSLAAERLPRSPMRSGTAVATIAVAIGSAVAISCVIRSFERAWIDWIEQHFAADLLVGGGGRIRLMAGPPIGDDIIARIARTPGVQAVEPLRTIPIQLGDRDIFLQTVALDDRLDRGGLPMVEGDLRDAAASLRAGSGVLLTDNLARRLGRHRGDWIDVPTPQGTRHLRIEGTFVDYLGSLDLGAVVLERSIMAQWWNDRSANLLRVWLEPGVPADDARSAVQAALGGGHGYYVLTAREFTAAVQAALDQFFVLAWLLQAVAVAVAIVGLINVQLAMIIDRSGELATLHTIGLSRRQTGASVVLECGMLGLLGGLSGAVIGVMLGAHFIVGSMPLITGWRFAFVVPSLVVAGAVAVATIVSAAAGWFPARSQHALDGAVHTPD